MSISTEQPNPTMTISRHSRTGVPSINGTESMKTFTGGAVWVDLVVSAPGGELSVANVNFAPCARTNWHRHENGQVLRVTAGSGWICDRGGQPVRIDVGDVIWCPPGTVHWHGADDDRYMVHQATSLGKAEWLEPVTDDVYKAKKRS
jgi:quercetin dioxygenase-like cupin family protein